MKPSPPNPTWDTALASFLVACSRVNASCGGWGFEGGDGWRCRAGSGGGGGGGVGGGWGGEVGGL